MTSQQAADHYSPDPNVLEQRACAYLKRLRAKDNAQSAAAAGGGADALRSLQRRAVVWSIAAGLVSGILIGAGEIYVISEVSPADAGWQEQAPYWLAFLAFAGLVSAIEILYLYWNALRAIAGITRQAGIETDDGAEVIFRGLARTGLEFPNPYTRVFGIDPYALMPRWRLVLQSVLYKMKVGVSSFLLRLFLRRVLARMVVRGLIPLVAAPLYAIWNAFITWRIVREARIRAYGPRAVDALLEEIEPKRSDKPKAMDCVMLHGAGELLMRACDAHPNYVYLLSRLKERNNLDGDCLDVDWATQRKALSELEPAEKAAVLDVLTLAAALGSKVYKSQKDLLADAMKACGMDFGGGALQPQALKAIRQCILEGRSPSRRDLARARQ